MTMDLFIVYKIYIVVYNIYIIKYVQILYVNIFKNKEQCKRQYKQISFVAPHKRRFSSLCMNIKQKKTD